MNCKSIVKNSATNQALVRCNVNCKQKRAQGKEEPKSIEKTSATNQALVRCNAFCKQNKRLDIRRKIFIYKRKSRKSSRNTQEDVNI